jgi:squalene synthase HpnC
MPATRSKTAAEENFPVASLLLPAATRRQVMAFYHFARTADDIADNPVYTPDSKILRLDALEEALLGRDDGAEVGASARDLRHAVNGDEALLAHAAQLLQAFRRDAVVDHCRDWGDLMMYCRFSAAPVGRFLLQLHGESTAAFGPSDSLCAALQVLNHLQDCADDLGTLGRVYIPAAWLRGAGLSHDVLAEEATCAELRQVFDITLDHVDGLIDLARPLPARINDRRLRLQAAITLVVAERLSARLRRSDPLARKVALTPLEYACAVIVGLWRGYRA